MAPLIWASHAVAPPPSTSRPICHGIRWDADTPIPAAHTTTNMYPPGGPTPSAAHSHTASTATTETPATASQVNAAAHAPTVTAAARATAMIAD